MSSAIKIYVRKENCATLNEPLKAKKGQEAYKIKSNKQYINLYLLNAFIVQNKSRLTNPDDIKIQPEYCKEQQYQRYKIFAMNLKQSFR